MRLPDLAFFGSLFLSRLADQVLLFLVPLVVFQTTGSVGWSGLAFFIETLPRFMAFPVCGILCDRIAPLTLMRRSQIWRAIACLIGLAGLHLTGGVAWLVALGAVCGVLTTQGIISREVLLPQVYRDVPFAKVVSWASIADQLGTVLGPLLAAALLGLLPWELVVAVTAGVFLLADIAVWLWLRWSRVSLPEPAHGTVGWVAPLLTAARHVRTIPGLLGVIALTGLVNLVLGVVLATAAIMATGYHGQSETFYGLLQSLGAVATIVILMVLARVSLSLRSMGIIAYIVICAGGALAGAGGHPWLYAAGFILVVGFDKMFAVFVRSLRQRILPPKDFGKTTGLIVLLNNLTQPLAGLLVAAMAGTEETRLLLLAVAGGMALVGLIAAPVMLLRFRHIGG